MENTRSTLPEKKPINSWFAQRLREFLLIGRDPIVIMSLLFSGIFIFLFVIFPLFQSISNGFINKTGQFDLKYFARYFENEYGPGMRQVFFNTLKMGLLTSIFGTIFGFIFAYAIVRCNIPGKKIIHWLALVPTVSPPFAIALSTILLLGRNGLVTHHLLGIEYKSGMWSIYGLSGLVFVQVISFFSVAYLMLRAMLERLNPSMEEAAESMGASRWHIFRTVTLPLLIPGIAGSFMLLFVESLADLGNPLFISGNFTVLSAQIFMAVIGEYDYQKASALAFVLLLPTLIIYLLQRYYVTRRSYVSVTGKPMGGQMVEKSRPIRWTINLVTYLFCILIIVLYALIFMGSFSTSWGVDYTPTLKNWNMMLTRGVEAILDTTFLSVLATPFAALFGMVVAFLVVRKNFSGKEALDFTSNLGGAVPGTILGIGFILAFNKGFTGIAAVLYAILAILYTLIIGKNIRERLVILLLGSGLGLGLFFVQGKFEIETIYYFLGGVYILIAGINYLGNRSRATSLITLLLGIYLLGYNLINYIADPIAKFSRSIAPGFGSNATFQFSDYSKMLFQPPSSLMAIALIFVGILLFQGQKTTWARLATGILALAVPCGLFFLGKPLVLVGGGYIILAAFIVRSLPASVRSGVAALQQIDPSIEEASTILGADAQYTFRKVTLPMILPALFAGLIFSFTRHMTSLSAIIFLVSARWNIITAKIMSEWEQGGGSIAAAYSSVIIVFVLLAIAILYFVTNKLLRGRGSVDITTGM